MRLIKIKLLLYILVVEELISNSIIDFTTCLPVYL